MTATGPASRAGETSSTAERTPVLSLLEAHDAIERGEASHVTSDVFDTLVWRPVARPADLFVTLGRSLRTQGLIADWVDDRTFFLARGRAEHEAREAAKEVHGAPECTLEEIWDHVPASFFTASMNAATGVTAELAAERRSLRAHPGASRLLRLARSRGIPVTLVSDTYFSPVQLTELLTGCGYDLTDVRVLTSSDRRMSKSDGLLAVAADGGGSSVIHVGDHPLADVAMAKRVGAIPCHVDLVEEADTVSSAHEPWSHFSAAAGTDGGRSAVIRETLNSSTRRLEPGYQFGVSVAGPLMAGFAGWAAEQTERLGASTIHCLLREGARIAELIDIVRPDGPGRRLVHASRWALLRAAVVDGTSSEIELSLARRADFAARHVADAFGCDLDRITEVLGGPIVPRSEFRAACAALADDDELRGQIVEASASMRQKAMRYLERTLVVDEGPIVICDIGWGGTIQEGLATILRASGIDNEVIGLYALLSPPGEHRVGGGARMLGYLPRLGPDGSSSAAAQAVTRHPEFLERVNTPQLGTLLEFDDDGTPVTLPDDTDEMADSLIAAQEGVIDFATNLASMALGDEDRRTEWFSDPRFAASALESMATVVVAPDRRLAAELGDWQHDDVAGTAVEALANEGFGRWLPYTNAVDASGYTMHEIYWFPGLAGRNDGTLGAQLSALANGADPDTVCPPSPTGTARIAVFEPGSTLALAQTETIPRLGSDNWMMLQLRTATRGLRSVRIDLAADDVVADIGDVEIVVTRDGTDEPWVDGIGDLRRRSTVVEGRWIGDGRPVLRAGGHLLVDLPAEIAPTVSAVAVTIGYRTWPAAADSLQQLIPRWTEALSRVKHGAARGIARFR